MEISSNPQSWFHDGGLEMAKMYTIFRKSLIMKARGFYIRSLSDVVASDGPDRAQSAGLKGLDNGEGW